MSKQVHRKFIVIVAIILVVALGLYALVARYYAAPTPAFTTVIPVPGTHRLDHVVIIMEENKAENSIVGNPAAPYINSLARQGALAANYYDVAKPSLPNYLALTSGTTNSIRSDCSPSSRCQVTATNITDSLERAHKTWREYAEDMHKPCTAYDSDNYAVRHNPFMYYPDITSDKSRCSQHVVDFTQLPKDFAAIASTPTYSFVTPNLCNDMHNCSVATGDKWLQAHAPIILDSPAFKRQNSLLVVVWDEGSKFDHHITTIFAGPAARAGYVSQQHYDHYALLHTVELNLGLKPLNHEETHSPLMNDMLRQ
jgi:phospholipase C